MQILTYITGWMNLDDRGGALDGALEPLAEPLTGAEEEVRTGDDGVIRVRWSATDQEAFARKVADCLERFEAPRYVHDCNFLD